MKPQNFFLALCLTTLNSWLFSLNGYTQSWLWAKSAGGTINNQNANLSVATDVAGNVFTSGWFFSSTLTFGSTTLTNADPSGNTDDIFIAKYDSAGTVLWAASAGGSGNDAGVSVSADASGNVFVTGMFSSSTITFGSTVLTNTV